MKAPSQLLILSLMAASFMGCGTKLESAKNDALAVNAPSSQTFAQRLVGPWARTDCHYDKDMGRDKTYTLNVTDQQVVHTVRYFRTATDIARCTQPSYTFESTYSYVIRPASAQGVWELDLKPVMARMTPQSEAAAAAFNSSAHLGYTQWVSGVTVTFDELDPVHFNSAEQFTIVHVAGNKLVWGDSASGEGSTPENRPNLLDWSNYEIRQ